MTGPPQPRAAGTLDACIIGSAALRACAAAGAAAGAEAFFLFIGFPPLALLAVFPAFLSGFMIALVLLFLAVPLYLLLRMIGPVRTGVSAGAGLLIGAFGAPALMQPDGWFPDAPWTATLLFGLPGLAAGFAFGRHVNRAAAESEE
ncbi:MAG TPA: hypothetical protein VF552_13545 [Allosphingosinicella sp.]|jgi:hypothetical protein